MSYTVSVNHPHFPEGTEFSVGNLGVVPNGSSKEIDEDDERLFLSARGLPLNEAYAGDAAIKVTGSGHLSKAEVDEVKAMFAAEEEAVAATEEKPEWLGTSSSDPQEEEGEVNG